MPMIATIGVSRPFQVFCSELRISAENSPERSATAAPIMMVSTSPSGAKLAKVFGIWVNSCVMFSSENRLEAR